MIESRQELLAARHWSHVYKSHEHVPRVIVVVSLSFLRLILLKFLLF